MVADGSRRRSKKVKKTPTDKQKTNRSQQSHKITQKKLSNRQQQTPTAFAQKHRTDKHKHTTKKHKHRTNKHKHRTCSYKTEKSQAVGAMVRLYLRNLKWNVTKEQLRWFLWRRVGIDAWNTAAVYIMRPQRWHGHENHSSAFLEHLSDAEAAEVFRHVGGCLDAEVCSHKRLHVEVAQPPCLCCTCLDLHVLQYY